MDLRAGAEAAHAIYSHFRVDPPSEHYRLHLGSYRGTAGQLAVWGESLGSWGVILRLEAWGGPWSP